jgi:hypothetical protein
MEVDAYVRATILENRTKTFDEVVTVALLRSPHFGCRGASRRAVRRVADKMGFEFCCGMAAPLPDPAISELHAKPWYTESATIAMVGFSEADERVHEFRQRYAGTAVQIVVRP